MKAINKTTKQVYKNITIHRDSNCVTFECGGKKQKWLGIADFNINVTYLKK